MSSCAGRLSRLGYVPGAFVRKSRRAEPKTKVLRRKGVIQGFPTDVWERILSFLVDGKAACSVMMMSMVDRALRTAVNDNVGVWSKLYGHWRGPLTYQSRVGVQLPTIPRILPNFRQKAFSATGPVSDYSTLRRADRGISELDTEEHRHQILDVYKRVVILQHSPCCGLCGTRRHATTPFWSLGMRLCKFCLQENLVSNNVLHDRFWVDAWSPAFVNSVVGTVFFFKEFGSARQRSEFTREPLDFQHPHSKTGRLVWFFWRPHLERLMDLSKLREAAILKQQAASVVRAWLRRAVVLRTLSIKDKKRPVRNVEWSLSPDKRVGLASLRLIYVLDRPPLPVRVDVALSRRMVAHEDHIATVRSRVPPVVENGRLVAQNLMGAKFWPLPA